MCPHCPRGTDCVTQGGMQMETSNLAMQSVTAAVPSTRMEHIRTVGASLRLPLPHAAQRGLGPEFAGKELVQRHQTGKDHTG